MKKSILTVFVSAVAMGMALFTTDVSAATADGFSTKSLGTATAKQLTSSELEELTKSLVVPATPAIAATTSCAAGQYKTSKGCVKQCSASTGFPYFLSDPRSCVTEKECTAKGYSVNKNNGTCVKKSSTLEKALDSAGSIGIGVGGIAAEACAPGYYGNNNKCVKCPKGYYCSSNKKIACPANATCNGTTFTCKAGYYGNNNKCVKCPKGYYCSSNKKIACPANATCDGTTFTCKAGFERKDSTCVKKCPSGQELKDGKCVCKTGYMTSKGCVKQCSASTGFPYFLSDPRSCVTEKECTAMGYSVNKNNGSCVKCPSDQELKDGKCLCKSGLPFNANGKCLQSWDEVKKISCDKGKFNIIANGWGMGISNTVPWKEFYNSICHACPANAKCDGINITCNDGFERKNSSCVAMKCTQNYTFKNEKGSCPIETPICQKGQCVKCKTDKDCLFDIGNGEHHKAARCESNGMCAWAENIKCPAVEGMYLDKNTLQCVCKDGYMMEDGKCVKKCPPNFILQNGKCVAECSMLADGSPCLKCNLQTGNMDPITSNEIVHTMDGTAGYCKNGQFYEACASVAQTECTSCNPRTGKPMHLDGKQCHGDMGYCKDGQCVPCPDGAYYNPNAQGCVCLNGLVMQNGQCVPNLPLCPTYTKSCAIDSDTIDTVPTGTCVRVKKLTCSGKTPLCDIASNKCIAKDDCVSKIVKNDQCLPCTSGYYADNYTCKKCPANAKCDGINITCNDGFERKNSSCVAMKCTQNYTSKNEKGSCPYDAPICQKGQCVKCQTNKECLYDNGGRYDAAFCINGRCEWAVGPDGSSVAVEDAMGCIEGYYMKNDQCVSCPKGYYCPGNNKRIACPAGTYNAKKGASSKSACKKCPYKTKAGSSVCNLSSLLRK